MIRLQEHRLSITARKATGQSLVEFVMVMPILVLVLIAGFGFGVATHQAHMVADAVQFPAMEKLSMANEEGDIGTGTLQGYMNGGNLKDNFSNGTIIDSVQLVDSDQYTSIMVGSRQATPPLNMAGFTIKSGQVINRYLLKKTQAGTAIQPRPYNTPWVPGGAINAPPWVAGAAAPAP